MAPPAPVGEGWELGLDSSHIPIIEGYCPPSSVYREVRRWTEENSDLGGASYWVGVKLCFVCFVVDDDKILAKNNLGRKGLISASSCPS